MEREQSGFGGSITFIRPNDGVDTRVVEEALELTSLELDALIWMLGVILFALAIYFLQGFLRTALGIIYGSGRPTRSSEKVMRGSKKADPKRFRSLRKSRESQV